MAFKKYLNPRTNMAFLHLFGKEKNKDILIAMLNSVLTKHLHKPIVDVQLIRNTKDPELAYKKLSILDVLCIDEDGCRYIIEMQVDYKLGFEKRAQYYASKVYINQANQGDKYEGLKRVIFLAFCDHIIFPDKKAYKSDHVTTDKETGSNDLKDIKFTFVELPKFMQQCPGDISKLPLAEKFYYFLSVAEDITNEAQDRLVGDDVVIKRAFDQIDYFNLSDQEKRAYESEKKVRIDEINVLHTAEKRGKEVGIKEGIKEGKEVGRKEGIKEGKEVGRKEAIQAMEEAGVITRKQAQAMLKKLR